MIDRTHALALTKQAELLKINRSSLYYRPKDVSLEDLELMRVLDELHLEHPFAGSRMLRGLLKTKGVQSTPGRNRIRRLMRKMRISAVYRAPRTTKRHPQHKVHPYLLRGLTIQDPNHVWAMDITYIPMARGFIYLAAVLDWATRKVLTWQVSNTLMSDFCCEVLERAIQQYGKPAIVNTDQGSQFTSSDFIDVIKDHQLKISMDGRGSWKDNVFVERLWRSLKYEEVYLYAYESIAEAKKGIGNYLEFYNNVRPHSGLAGCTPNEVYFKLLSLPEAA